MSDFPKKNYLVYIPNNFQVWYKALVVHASHDYGVLVTSLINKKLINFDRVVSDISFPMSRNPLTRAKPEVKNEADGSITEGDSPDVTPDREPTPPLSGGRMTASDSRLCIG
jgi:hypothetical protein